MTPLPTPTFFDKSNAASWQYRPDHQVLFEAADTFARNHGVKPSGSDKYKVHLLLIDVQKDFTNKEGSLYVGGRSGEGAIEDCQRTAEFIYRNLGVLTDITTTLDTHFTSQIFFPTFWLGPDDKAVAPHTVITSAGIKDGTFRPNPAMARMCGGNFGWLAKQALFYCEELEKAGKYQLYIWPFHCLLGSQGHALNGLVHEARIFHSFVRRNQSDCEVKGGNPFTENYSVLSPEVLMRHDGKPLGQKNSQFIKTLLDADAVVIAGQAASHCVKSSIDDLLNEITAQDPSLTKKVYIMEDCMSSVVVPGVLDFTDEAESALERFKDAGMNVVKSTDLIKSWPGIRL